MHTDYRKKIVAFYSTHRRMPTYSEMMALFNFKSKNAVARVVEKMREAGLVTKDSLGKLLPTDVLNGTPFLGSVKAGLPSSVEEITETLTIDEYLIKRKDQTYLLEVEGESMIDAHIAHGDIVVAERSQGAKDGDIVIAHIDGAFTMKYFRQRNNKVWLEPANKQFAPLYPKHSLSVIAVIKGVIRRY
ncbi:MAG TPA: transcriptional repressor LexA [Candidatus Paceibacterota bacterium]|nr:transcriptional repressor LexA [Candidatus Paceibacterota bacterium]